VKEKYENHDWINSTEIGTVSINNSTDGYTDCIRSHVDMALSSIIFHEELSFYIELIK